MSKTEAYTYTQEHFTCLEIEGPTIHSVLKRMHKELPKDARFAQVFQVRPNGIYRAGDKPGFTMFAKYVPAKEEML